MKIEFESKGFKDHRYLISSSFYLKSTTVPEKREIYMNGLRKIKEIIEGQSKWTWRLYYDDSVDFSLIEDYLDCNKIELVQFRCEKFKDKVGHFDHFGTLIRFLPIFFENFEVVIISDIDIDDKIFNDVYIDKFMAGDEKIFIRSSLKKVLQDHIYFEREVMRFPANAQMYVKGSLESKLFTDFLDRYDELTKKYREHRRFFDNLYYDAIQREIKTVNSNPLKFQLRKQKDFLIAPYGIDEFFINEHVLLKLDPSTPIMLKMDSKIPDILYVSQMIWWRVVLHHDDIQRYFIPGVLEGVTEDDINFLVNNVGKSSERRSKLNILMSNNLKAILANPLNYKKYILGNNDFLTNRERCWVDNLYNYKDMARLSVVKIENLIFR
jgi:hypothetical protein